MAIRTIALVGSAIFIVLLLFLSLGQKPTYDNTILFVLDISYSMNAKDVKDNEKISRLDAAKEIIKQTVKAGGDANYGLVIFSQSATYYVPPTIDTGTFLDYVKDVNIGLLPGGGTDWDSLKKIFSGNKTDYAKIIFISDAEASAVTSDEGSWSPERKLGMNNKGFEQSKKYFIGVGTEEGGNPTLPNGTIMKMNGKNIVTSFDMKMANMITKFLDAQFFHIEDVNTMDDVIGDIVSSSPSFLRGQVQILVVVLGVFILLAL